MTAIREISDDITNPVIFLLLVSELLATKVEKSVGDILPAPEESEEDEEEYYFSELDDLSLRYAYEYDGL